MAGGDGSLILATPSIELIFPLDLYKDNVLGNYEIEWQIIKRKSWIIREVQIYSYLFICGVKSDSFSQKRTHRLIWAVFGWNNRKLILLFKIPKEHSVRW